MGKQFAQTQEPEPAADEMTPKQAAALGQPNESPLYPGQEDITMEPDPEHVDNRDKSDGDFGGQDANTKANQTTPQKS